MDEKEKLRIELLEVLLARGTRFGTSAKVAGHHVRQDFGRNATDEEIEEQLEYLADGKRGLVEPVTKVISTENRVWRITPRGRAFLDERGY